jgi:RNA polymerase sigma factor (TIGR02999 family)
MSEPSAHPPGHEITRLLAVASHGNEQALAELLPLVYEELRRIAHGKLRVEREGHTLNTTALVHEAYVKLVDQTRVEWRGRSHFFGVASEAMRRILIDYAKLRRARKRGSGAGHLPLEAAENLPSSPEAFSDAQALELIALDEALTRLAAFNPEGARIVQHRFFGGLSNDEVAEVTGSSERSVRRSWTVARAWLRRELEPSLAIEGDSLLGSLSSPR